MIDCSNNDRVVYRGVVLNNQRENQYRNIPILELVRSLPLDSIITEIGTYFPVGHVKNFAIFNPRNMPLRIGETSTYGNIEVSWLCEYFALGNCLELLREFHKLLNDICLITNFSVKCGRGKQKQ